MATNHILNLICYAGSDTQPVTISGWTTSPGNFIRVVAPLPYGQRGPTQRHQGTLSGDGYRLEVDGTCITSSVGNLRLEGLQLHCSADPGVDLFGVLLDGYGAGGFVDVSQTIIRLDDADTERARVGIEAELVRRAERPHRGELGDLRPR